MQTFFDEIGQEHSVTDSTVIALSNTQIAIKETVLSPKSLDFANGLVTQWQQEIATINNQIEKSADDTARATQLTADIATMTAAITAAQAM